MTEPTVELLPQFSTPNPDRVSAVAARGDHLDHSLVGDGLRRALNDITSGGSIESNSSKIADFIAQLLRRGHFGPFEHAQAFFVAEGISRDQMAQITRHRHMSWDVQSMRYVDFDDAEFTIPPEAEGESLEIEAENIEDAVEYPADQMMKDQYEECLETYKDLLESGVEREDARKVLPIGTEVNMSFSGNLRSLFHVFDLRVSGKAQDDTRGFTQQVLEETRDWAPLSTSAYEEHVKGNSLRAP
jgi:thymidylate synthase (FAD)